MKLSILLASFNCRELAISNLNSIQGLRGEVLVSDQGSRDGTVETCKKFGAKVITDRDTNLGRRKQRLIDKAKGDWILVLDADERLSDELKQEIKELRDDTDGYWIPYQNYVFGKPVYFGGENYEKVRLFRRGKGRVLEAPLHEEIVVEGSVGQLKGRIIHHSYRTPWQLFSKFTRYAFIQARQPEQVTLKKLFLYGPHMFWSRFVKEQGYKDRLHGFVLAAAFAYMEGLTYWLMLLQI